MAMRMRMFSMFLMSLVRSQRCSREVVQGGMPIRIHVPRGSYDATATFERFVWHRPFGRTTTKLYTKVESPDGIPYFRAGHQYSLYEYSVEGHDLDRATARGTEIALAGHQQNQGMFLRPSVSSI